MQAQPRTMCVRAWSHSSDSPENSVSWSSPGLSRREFREPHGVRTGLASKLAPTSTSSAAAQAGAA